MAENIPDTQTYEPEKEKSGFGMFIAGLAAVLFTLGLVACLLLWKYAQIYEVTVPEPYMANFMSNRTPEDWKEYLFENVEAELSEFENDTELFRELYDTYLSNTELTWRYSTAESTRDSSVFIVSAGNINLCRVTLVPPEGEKLAFGRHTWTLGSITPCSFTDSLKNITVEITAPAGKKLYINGVPLSSNYLAGETEAPNLTDLEKRIGTDIKFRLYRIENVYGSLKLTDDSGNTYSCERDADVYRYVVPSEDTWSFTVEAPESVTVSVCGVDLDREDVTDDGEYIFEGLEKYTGGEEWKTLVYSLSGLYTEPVITARDSDGTELSPFVSSSGKIYFFLPEKNYSDNKASAAGSFFRRYLAYARKSFDTDDTENYDNLLYVILPGTDLYNYVCYSRDAMAWASYTNIKYDEISYEDIRSVGKDAFFCTVRFSADVTAYQWGEQKKYSETTGFELLFIKRNGMWYAAAMSALT